MKRRQEIEKKKGGMCEKSGDFSTVGEKQRIESGPLSAKFVIHTAVELHAGRTVESGRSRNSVSFQYCF